MDPTCRTLKAADATIHNIRGVGLIETSEKYGKVDLVSLCPGLSMKMGEMEKTINGLRDRVQSAEIPDYSRKFDMPQAVLPPPVSTREDSGKGDSISKSKFAALEAKLANIDKEIAKQIEEFVAENDDLRGPSGPVGPAGPRGPKLDKLQDIKDVCADGIQDGCILVYRKGKWVVELPEE